MKYIAFSLLLANAFSLFAMQSESEYVCAMGHPLLLKPITIAPTETLKYNLKDNFHPLADKLGNKKVFPMQVFMEIQAFYNEEDDVQKKRTSFDENAPYLFTVFFFQHKDVLNHFKNKILK